MIYKVIKVKNIPFIQADAITIGCVIFTTKDDEGLIEHEKVHVEQFYRSYGLFPFLYIISKRYRLDSEVEAYKVSIAHGMSVYEASKMIAENYKLDVNRKIIARRLKN